MGKDRKKIGIIGVGKMGGALIEGILRAKVANSREIIAADIDQKCLEDVKTRFGCETTPKNRRAGEAETVIIAVKPQVIGEVIDDLAETVKPTTLVISIAAGITTGAIEKRLGKEARIIRAMPNTPAMIGEGVTALAPGRKITEADLIKAKNIFEAVGKTVVVKEELMDVVTGLSGSGPAYVFTFIEALSDGGVLMGLDRDTARLLAAQTVLGAAKLLLEKNAHPAELRDMVTSPGGTTIAGLKALEEGKLRATLISAVEQATRRAQLLGRG
ncbi:MAG: pyrroline-5-carboxylate reductase [Syntrophales bacterium]|nr:pyrroline-5-carboxylate reductase [Syntrophales bacterium]